MHTPCAPHACCMVNRDVGLPPEVGPIIMLADFSVCLLFMPGGHKGRWGLVAQGGMWPSSVVISPPFFQAISGFFQREEPVLIEAFFAQPTVECFNERVVSWCPGTTESEFDSVAMRPRI